mmetsp:Transcript_34565/g.96967  ORF Transcript_34565/g.96967 Transcript_34565/m.96967 type:complete len:251 (+) Transcript_34565:346-1098(+)
MKSLSINFMQATSFSTEPLMRSAAIWPFDMAFSAYSFPLVVFLSSVTNPKEPWPRKPTRSRLSFLMALGTLLPPRWSLEAFRSEVCFLTSLKRFCLERDQTRSLRIEKLIRSTSSTMQSSLRTRTVAERGSSASRALSPKWSPTVSSRITFPSLMTLHVPSKMMKKESPTSPCETTSWSFVQYSSSKALQNIFLSSSSMFLKSGTLSMSFVYSFIRISVYSSIPVLKAAFEIFHRDPSPWHLIVIARGAS